MNLHEIIHPNQHLADLVQAGLRGDAGQREWRQAITRPGDTSEYPVEYKLTKIDNWTPMYHTTVDYWAHQAPR